MCGRQGRTRPSGSREGKRGALWDSALGRAVESSSWGGPGGGAQRRGRWPRGQLASSEQLAEAPRSAQALARGGRTGAQRGGSRGQRGLRPGDIWGRAGTRQGRRQEPPRCISARSPRDGGREPGANALSVPAPRRPRGSVFPPELRPSILRFNVTVWFVTPTVLSCPFAPVL